VSSPLESLHELLNSVVSAQNASITSGPSLNSTNGVQEWHIQSSAGNEIVVGVTQVALSEAVDLAGVITGDDFASRLAAATQDKVMYISSDLKVREWNIETM
jgi:hypothetical protein